MSRNKYPEETVRKILDVSYRLFLERGYDHTTIQDIVDALGMSKGAIYHHFKSKEDILDKITTQHYDRNGWYQNIRLDLSLTGFQKLRAVLIFEISDHHKVEMDGITANVSLNPRLITLILTSTMQEAAPFLLGLIEEGVADGSIRTDYPRELSEVLLLLLNIWIGLFSETSAAALAKMAFLGEMMSRMGLPLIDDEIMSLSKTYFDRLVAPNSPPGSTQQ